MISRAQGTLEYLVILAVVIVMALIAVGFFTDVLGNQSSLTIDSTGELNNQVNLNSSGISIKDAVVDLSGNGVIRVQNVSGEDFTISGISGGSVSSSFVSNLSAANFSLRNLGTSCTCSEGERSKICDFDINYAGPSGLQKTSRLSVVVDCVTDALVPSHVSLATHEVAWAKGATLASELTFAIAKAVFVDSSDNIYVGGRESGDINFGQGVGLTPFFTEHFFVTKYDSSGNAIWARGPYGGYNGDEVSSIFVDSSGNVYIAGYFYTDLNFGSGIYLTNNAFATEFFVAKYNSDGVIQWAKNSVNGQSRGMASAVVADSSGNVYVGGWDYNNINFGNGVSLLNRGTYDLFLVKYDSSGNAVWAKSGEAATGLQYDYITDLDIDSSDNIYASGYINSDLNLSPSIKLTHKNQMDFYIAKYNSDGEVLWAKEAYSSSGNGYDQAQKIVVDQSGNIYTCGPFDGTLSFSSDVSLVATQPTAGDFFLVKYNSSGTPLWAQKSSAQWSAFCSSISVDSVGHVYVAGSTYSDLNFGSEINLINRSAEGDSYDYFVAEFDSSGNPIWATNPVEGTGSYLDQAFSSAIDSSDNVYVSGDYYSDTNFSPSVGLILPDAVDFFLVKYNHS